MIPDAVQYAIGIYLIFINLLGFCLFGIDKRKAQNRRWRIPERTLLLTAVIGGSIGCILGMKLFHHKTLHAKFSIGLPAILIIQIVMVICVYFLF